MLLKEGFVAQGAKRVLHCTNGAAVIGQTNSALLLFVYFDLICAILAACLLWHVASSALRRHKHMMQRSNCREPSPMFVIKHKMQ